MRVAAPGAATDAFNPFAAFSLFDYVGLWNVYESLAWLVGAEVQLGLAEAVEPNADGTQWTITLRDANFHDGSPVRPEDVGYSLRTLGDPAQSPFFAQFFAGIQQDGVSFPDDHTVVVPLLFPQGDFLESIATISIIVPEGTAGGPEAVGSGPFRLDAYEAGKSMRLSRNDDYWDSPPALLDGVEVIAVTEATARLNGLKGGELDYVAGIPPAGARAEADNDDIAILPGSVANSTAYAFAANTQLPPFNDPRAVRALKLAVDRQTLVNTVLLGFGEIGNDIVGKGLPGYNDSIPQIQRDAAQARSLFEAAGVTDLTIRTGEVVPGTLAAAELLVQQLAEVGVGLTLDEIPADQFFSDFPALFATPLQSAYWTNRPAASHASLLTGSQGGFNITGLGGEEYDGLLAQLRAAVDPDLRNELSAAVQAYLHEHDGMVVWGYLGDLNAGVPGLSGIIYSQGAPRFHRASFGA